MPPWPSRIQPSGNHAPEVPPKDTPPSLRPGEIRTPALYEPPQLHSQPEGGSPSSTVSLSNRPPRHGRSISHPFPSFFGGSRKIDKRLDEPLHEAIFDGSNYEVEPSSATHVSRSPSYKNTSKHTDGDFVTGNCATCDSTVRWPRRLDVYRCTVCLMVNDLKTWVKKDTALSTGSQYSSIGDPLSVARAPSSGVPLSVDRTRQVIEHCTYDFLRSRLRYCMRTDSMPQLDVRNDGKRDRPFPPPRWAGHPPSVLDTPQTMSPSVAEQPRYTPMTQARTSSKSPDDYINSHSYTAPVRPPPSPPRVHATLGKEPFQDDTNIAMIKQIFRPLENYIATSMDDLDCLNSSFLLSRPSNPTRSSSEASVLTRRPKKVESYHGLDDTPFELDAKTLLLGDIGENGTWWAGERQAPKKKSLDESEAANPQGDRKHLRHDWSSIGQWYDLVFSCGRSWRAQSQFFSSEEKLILMDPIQALYIDETLAEARVHIQRSFFKMQENLLRRPGRLLKVPEECRFLLILLGNPLLYPYRGGGPLSPKSPHSEGEYAASMESTLMQPSGPNPRQLKSKEMSHRAGATGQHSGIIKRILGLIANLSNDCHQTFVSWFCRTPEAQFRELVDLVGGFVSYRLGRSQGRKTHANHDPTAGLIPHMSGPGAGTSAHLHAALRPSGRNPKKEPKDKTVVYEDEWQVKAAAKVMSLLFAANTSYGRSSRHELTRVTSDNPSSSMNLPPRPRAARHGQLLPTNTFYNTLLDYADLVADFETWESRKGKFSFCQYPIFLSIWAKIHIMEHDARRQMEFKARDAFFTSIMSNKAVSQYLLLKVRRDCLVDDSLRGVSEVVGTGQEEIKKGLRIEFVGEEGVDAGGLRKEWFLLLIREVFDPDHGLFVYDEESHYCYFNPNTFETSDQFYLVGVVIGLAIYNSTILDVALPPFAFRKLLASAPAYAGPTTTATRPSQGYTLDDLAEWKPALAKGLKQLLDHDGDVEETFCRDFVVDVDRHGQVVQVPLCPNGEKRAVTNANRREFVDLYIRYLLDTAVARQYEPFKRGFYTVCGGNALSLFRPEEIELLVRGSEEPLDVASLRAVAVHENWGPNASQREEVPVVSWFWEIFSSADMRAQRKILAFITGSDRIPAMGATSLVIKIVCLGNDAARFPIARTCFNMLGLHRYRSRPELESKLWRAVQDSEGFGLK